MIIQKNIYFIVRHFFYSIIMIIGLIGCQPFLNILKVDNINCVKLAEKTQKKKLKIPSDLTQLQDNNYYSIPELTKNIIVVPKYNLQ